MKIYWSALLLFAALLSSCSKEQFGTAAQKVSNPVTGIQTLEQHSCANLTLINPEVDILYVIDNSSSNWYVPSEVKSAIQNTINSISADFDYRVIGTPLLATSSGNNDYQVLVKNSTTFPSALNAKRVSSASEFNFFSGQPIQSSQESGLQRVRDFITAHNTDGLFRQNAYLFVILVSNGRDTTVEQGASWNPQETTLIGNGQNGTVYGDRLNALKQVKSSLNARQFRLFSLTPSTVGGSTCPSGYLTANKSYVQMSKDLYLDHTPAIDDQGSTNFPDHYNLCSGSGVSGVFASVNASIKKIVIPHKYRYWPVTMSATVGLDDATLQVYRENPSTGKVLMARNSQWQLIPNPGSVNTRIEPTPGEPTNAPNVIQFLNGNDIVYPDCISMTSATNTEYFKSVVLTKPAVQNDPVNPIVVKINGQVIPSSAYSYRGYVFDENIKVSHMGYLDTPEQKRTGYFITISDSNYYYKSGDSVEVGFKPAPL